MELKSLIAEARQVYEAAGLDCGDGLLPPADEATVDGITTALSQPVPAELRELYALHGGQEYIPPGVRGLFGQHRLLSPAEVIKGHTNNVENYLDGLGRPPVFPPAPGDPGEWTPELIPFASWDSYELCIHATTGEMWEFEPWSGLIRHRANVAAVLTEIIAAVRAGKEPELEDYR